LLVEYQNEKLIRELQKADEETEGIIGVAAIFKKLAIDMM